MAPRQSTAHRRSMAQSETFHDLGVRGRKTGVTLKDTGVRDEHGMQPLDDIFSSPDRESQAGGAGANGQDASEEESEDEASMDIDEVTAPAPSAFMNGRPPARARSPVKTSLGSPPRRARGMSSSPIRAPNFNPGSPSGGKSVQRKLDFKKNPLLASKPFLPKPNGVNGKVKGKGKAVATSFDDYRSSPSELGEGPEYTDVEPQTEPEESMAILNDLGADDTVDEHDNSVEEEEAPPSAKKGRGRPKKSTASKKSKSSEVPLQSIEGGDTADEEPVRTGKKRGRAPKNAVNDEADAQPAKKKAKGSSSSRAKDADNEPQKQAPKARGRKPKAAPAETSPEASTAAASKKPAIPKQKRAGKQASPAVADTSVAEVPRGPPLPKSRGLVITRREALGSGSDMFKTRSGRTSYRPLQYWRNERTELDNDDVLQDGKTAIVLPHIKNIIRIDEPEAEHRGSKSRRKGRAGRKGGKRRGRAYISDDDDDEELEPWEADGDVITGETAVWQPEHEANPPGPDEEIEVADEQIAVSANAIQTREIRNATFKFAKTASMPFFGTGVVDLPPHSEKKPKNSRKMYMAFSVLTGRVTVTVADTVFSIGRGGQFFVPRGNYYSMENVLDKPARLFFSQGCEVAAGQGPDASQLTSVGV